MIGVFEVNWWVIASPLRVAIVDHSQSIFQWITFCYIILLLLLLFVFYLGIQSTIVQLCNVNRLALHTIGSKMRRRRRRRLRMWIYFPNEGNDWRRYLCTRVVIGTIEYGQIKWRWGEWFGADGQKQTLWTMRTAITSMISDYYRDWSAIVIGNGRHHRLTKKATQTEKASIDFRPWALFFHTICFDDLQQAPFSHSQWRPSYLQPLNRFVGWLVHWSASIIYRSQIAR